MLKFRMMPFSVCISAAEWDKNMRQKKGLHVSFFLSAKQATKLMLVTYLHQANAVCLYVDIKFSIFFGKALLVLHQPEIIELWNPDAPMVTFWDIRYGLADFSLLTP